MQDSPFCSACGTRLTAAQLAAATDGGLCPTCSGESTAGGDSWPRGGRESSRRDDFSRLSGVDTSDGQDAAERDALIAPIDELDSLDTEPERSRGYGAVSEAAADRPPVDASRECDDFLDPLDETLTESDTVGALDTDAPDFDDDAAHSWQEGVLVAGRFRLQKFIGRGGMGKVYVAQDETLKRRIALKRIPQEIIFDVDARDDLRQEANRLLDLAHENIVRVHTYYDGPTWPFFAMEYLEGPTLKKLLRERKREGRAFSPEEVEIVARQVGQGLVHAHDHRIVHRDLKPANLMLARPPGEVISEADTVKITDFGISRVVHDSTLRNTGKRSGTLPYMSPEQFRGDPCTPRSDVYSLACTLYELLTGSPPFVSGDIGYQIIHVEPKPFDQLEAADGTPRKVDCPETLARAIERGLAKLPEERFDSVEDFLAAIDGVAPVSRDGEVAGSSLRPGIASVVSKAFAGAILASLVLWAAAVVFPPGAKPDGGGAQIGSNGSVSDPLSQGSSTPVDRRKSFDDFSQWLHDSLEPQLPTVIGSRHATQVSASFPPTMNLELSFVEDEAPRGAALLARVIFEVARADSDGVPATHQVPGFSENGIRRFRFVELSEGSHVLRAFLSTNGTVLGEKQKLFDHPLEVDLTPPRFDLEAVDEDVLVDPEDAGSDAGGARQLFATFEESLEIRLVPASGSGEGDLSRAYYQVITPDSTSNPIEIDDPRSWFVPRLTPGERRTLRVYGEDRVGQRSDERNFVFHRHRMELAEFQVSDVIANKAPVNGTFRYEGGAYPDLVFFVNGEKVEAPWRIVSGESRETAGEAKPFEPAPARPTVGILTSVSFEAELPLSKSTNTVEVQYAWKERRPRPFPKGGILERVRMRAPNIEFAIPAARRAPVELVLNPAQKDTLYTRKNNVTVEGSVEPYVAGVQLQLVVHNDFGSLEKAVVIDPAESGTTGRFSSELELEPGLRTFVALKSYYKGESEELLRPERAGSDMPDTVEIFCDQDVPSGSLSFQVAGEQLVVRIQSDEPASALRCRLAPIGGGGMISWKSVSSSPVRVTPEPSYTWRTSLPVEPSNIEVEITDFAGNTGSLSEFFNPQIASNSAIFEPGASRGSSGSLEPGMVILRSDFLRDVDMNFQVCDISRLEFSRTEVSEYVWYLFLEERALRELDRGSGRRSHPAVIEEQQLRLLPDFVRWFQVNAADGYEYSIPTVDEWLCAFVGVRTPEAARREIADWFANEQSGFSWKQSEAYGQDRISALASRPSILTPTALLDMESNLEEIVRDSGDMYLVIGGHNVMASPEELEQGCLEPRAVGAVDSSVGTRFLGLRLARRPKERRE